MTSSFGNILGTQRDKIPVSPVDNYQRTDVDLTEQVNNEIDRNKEDTKRFYDQMKEIERLRANQFFENLNALGGLVSNVAEFKKVSEANKAANELTDSAKKVYKTKLGALLKNNLLKEGVLKSEETAYLTELSKNDPKILAILKARSMNTQYEVGIKQLKDNIDTTVLSAFGTYAEDNNVYDQDSLEKASEILLNGEDALYTQAILNANALGIPVDSREFREYFIKELYPKIQKRKEKLLSTWDTISTRNYESRRQDKIDDYITDGYLSITDTYKPKFGDPETGIITRIKNDLPDIETDKEALFYLATRTADLAINGELDATAIEFLLNEAEFTNRSTGKTVFGLTNSGIGTNAERRIAIDYLNNALNKIRINPDAKLTTIRDNYRVKIQEYLAENNGVLDPGQKLVFEANYRQELKDNGLDVNSAPPQELLTDESSGAGTEGYSNRVGKPDTLASAIDITGDWVQKKREAGLNITALNSIENREAERALGDLRDKFNKFMSSDINATLDDFIAKVYPTVLADLVAGNYAQKYSGLLATTARDIQNDRNVFKLDIPGTLGKQDFVSLHEKRALDQYVEYVDSEYQKPFPKYFREITKGTNISAHKYALERLKNTGGIDANNRLAKDAMDRYDLTEEDKQFILNFANTTKNLNLLNSDPDRKIESTMLTIFRDAAGNPDVGAYKIRRDPNRGSAFNRRRTDGDRKTVREIFDIANAGGEDFGLFKFSGSEIKELVKSGSVRLDENFDEDTQKFMVLGLMRIQANRSNSIMGAVTEGRDWRRLTNLSTAEQQAILQFFPNLRGMPNNQFQELQADVAEAVLKIVNKK